MKIDFHILNDGSGLKSLRYACKVVASSHQAGKKVFIQTNTQEEANQLNDLLWTYEDDSFIPHALFDPSDTTPPPVQIGYSTSPPKPEGILLNLSSQIPGFYQSFEQLIEIVFSDPVMQQLARDRYKTYRDSGHELTTHKIASA